MTRASSPNPTAKDNWGVPGSLALGSLVIGFFVPWFFILAGLMIGVLCSMLLRASKRSDQLETQLADAYDIQRTQSERAELLGGLIDAADIPILATNADGVIVHVNTQSSQVLGIGQAMLARRLDEVLTQEQIHELEAAARAGEPGHARLSLAINGEMREFDASADPIPDVGGAVLTFRDITELSRAMTLKADFVANASHELRTPIASIQGAIETLAGPARHDEQMSDRLIEIIASNATRLELLATDLIDLSKVEGEDHPPAIEQVQLNALIDQVFNELLPGAHRRKLTLEATLDTHPMPIETDPALVELILRNLVGNAIKFAHENTTIRVVVEHAKIALDRTAPIPAELNRPMGIIIRVIDQGVGIPLAHQQRVFERFYQVDDARTGSGAKRGTGLGLAIVKHAARRLGGSVTLESVHQVGTTVQIELPRCAHQDTTSP